MNQTTKAPPKPCILGIVTAEMLSTRRWPSTLWSCDGVELRADGIPADDIASAVSDFDNEKCRRGFSGPVVFTLRLQRDGGAWPDAESADRNPVWESLPPGTCDWVDLEIEETSRINPQTLDALRSSGVKILLSHHAFTPELPTAWMSMLTAMVAWQPEGVKFAVMPHPDQVVLLLDFARLVGTHYDQACVLGMGAHGMPTRLISPMLGCPFTYGFLGEGPVAPGQLHVDDMKSFFKQAAVDATRPVPDASAASWLEWADGVLKKVRGV